jgi:hypothetical protein
MGRRLTTAALAALLLCGCSNPVIDTITKIYDAAGGFVPVFSASKTTFIFTEPVTFTNGTTADVQKFHWDFGDGTTAENTASPSHTYTQEGIYTVTLTATSMHNTVRSCSIEVWALGTDPYISVKSPVTGWVTGTSVPITVNVMDMFSSSGATPGVYTVEAVITDSAHGTHTVSADLASETGALAKSQSKAGYDCTLLWDTTLVPEGPVSIVITAEDGDNETEEASVNVNLETTAPAVVITLAEGASYVAGTTVLIDLNFTDSVSHITQMRFSNNGSSWSDWEPYATEMTWTLAVGDGLRTVYAEVRDNAGLSSTAATDSITVDTAPPVFSSFTVGSGSYTNSTSVTLYCSVTDSGSGMDTMSFSNNGTTWTPYTYAATCPWSIPSGDGVHTVWARFTDKSGKTTTSQLDTIILDTLEPTFPAVVVNGGAAWVTSKTLSLGSISASEATSGLSLMCINEDNTTWTAWQAFSASTSYTVSAADGTNRTVYIRVKDGAGNTSASGSATYKLDTTAPATPTVVIENADSWTSSSSVDLTTISSSDATSGLSEMSFSTDGSSWSSWQSYATSASRSLSGGDGFSKYIYVRVRDAAENVSSSGFDTIGLDTTHPTTPSVEINWGNEWTNDPEVTLTSISSYDAGSGPSEMCISTDDSSWSPWQPYSSGANWTLDGGDGFSKYIYVRVRDVAGNVSESGHNTIGLDTGKPSISIILLNDGEAYTNSDSITVGLNAVTDSSGSGVSLMRFSNDSFSWSSWEPYAASTEYTLTEWEGNMTVWCQVQDAAGNESVAVSSMITLDRTAPEISQFQINGGALSTTSAGVTLMTGADDLLSGVSEQRNSNDGSNWSAWSSFTGSNGWTLASPDGTKTVYCQVRDEAGNWTQTTASIILDANAPVVGSFSINEEDVVTDSSTVTLYNSVTDATDMTMSFSNDYGGTWSTAEAYASTKSWLLTAGQGLKNVWARFTDANGHWTDVYDFIDYEPTYETITRDDIAALDSSMTDNSLPVGIGMQYLFRTAMGYYGKMRITGTSPTLVFEETVYDEIGNVMYTTPSTSVTDGFYFHLEGGFQTEFVGGSDFLWNSGSGMLEPVIPAEFCLFN